MIDISLYRSRIGMFNLCQSSGGNKSKQSIRKKTTAQNECVLSKLGRILKFLLILTVIVNNLESGFENDMKLLEENIPSSEKFSIGGETHLQFRMEILKEE